MRKNATSTFVLCLRIYNRFSNGLQSKCSAFNKVEEVESGFYTVVKWLSAKGT